MAAAKVPSPSLASALGIVTGKWIQYALQQDTEAAREPTLVGMILGNLFASWRYSSASLLSGHAKHLGACWVSALDKLQLHCGMHKLLLQEHLHCTTLDDSGEYL